MKITAIAPQKRRANRYSISIDGEYQLSLSQDRLADLGLRVGDDLTEEQLANIQQVAEEAKALDKVYGFLSYRSRSRQEVVQYLHKMEYPDSRIEAALMQLEETNLINDQRFADEWIANRQALSPRSSIELRAELRQKGIASSVIDLAIEALDEDADVIAARELIQTKRLRYRYDDERSLIQYLANKGYSYRAIKQALEEKTEE